MIDNSARKNWYNYRNDMTHIFMMERILVLLAIVDKDGLFG
jgi:hypothetical protein